MGAPPGNKNALKHGLYAKRITPAQQAILGEAEPLDMGHEIFLLRAAIDHIMGEINALRNPSIQLDKNGQITNEQAFGIAKPEALAMLYNSLFSGVNTLNTVVRTKALLGGNDSELEQDIEAGMVFYRQHHGVYDYLTPPDPKQAAKLKRKKGRRTGRRPG